MTGPAGHLSLLQRFRLWLAKILRSGEMLCDSCRYDHPSACRNPQRPNATRCKDYRPR